ncbi:type A2 lantipeptide [Streptomyces montanisoli]|uniref:Type A2 lantipeptide n=1 Tax=Streptomyces montanisoli TaxID=2798581 RepID=A0A940MCH6_9ACTN|nr:type A2 lantipeptide [Streptomyces montanisoli]MBP0458492.1 type A2 lantipeptide [Streptomyces montanisoli]
MNNTPQVQTQEISDADLDNVSGGLVAGAVDGVVGAISGVNVGGVLSSVDTTISPMVNTSGVTGLVSGL